MGGVVEPPKCRGDFIGLGAVDPIDDFNSSSRQPSGDNYRGAWSSFGNGTDLSPSQNPWEYEQHSCSDAGDLSLHVTGADHSWAHFILTLEAAVDLSEYDGLVFWGSSTGPTRNSVRFRVRNAGAEQTQSTYQNLTVGEWRQYKIPFPEGVARDEVLELKFVIDEASVFDFWIDDLSFYADAP